MSCAIFSVACFLSLFFNLACTIEFDSIVAQDGTGNFTTISQAIAAAPDNSPRRYNIKIKPGRYTEFIRVKKEKINLSLIGDGMDTTIVSGNLSDGTKSSIFESPTIGNEADGFTASFIAFENTAGPQNGRAVALLSAANSSFYKCRIQGFQDTLLAAKGQQFYRECEIYGTVDFIFGNAQLILQNCGIFARLPLVGQSNMITAQGRDNTDVKGGTIFHNCTITATQDLKQRKGLVKTFLGRPWFDYARVVYMQCFLDDIVDPSGWSDWEGRNRTGTVYYGEFDNRGPGSNTSLRVKWPGFKVLTKEEVTQFTVRNFIEWQKWIPKEIPVFLDLI